MTKVILDIPIGETLKAFRKRAGYTQVDVVRKANLYGSRMSESTYSKIEQGNRNIFASDLVILKLVLGFSYEDIFGRYENMILNDKL